MKLNDFYDNVLPIPLVKTQQIDSNNDNLIDTFKLKITFASTPNQIQNIKMMIFFNYELSSKVSLTMQTMCTIDIDTPMGASYLYTNGYLKLKQKSPIFSSTIAQTIYYTDIFQNATSPMNYVDLYKEFTSRNLTTAYTYDKLLMPYRSSSETQLEIEILIPSYQEIM